MAPLISEKRVLVAISGGVDSSVAAAILKRKGFKVIGVFLKFWQPSFPRGKQVENICCSEQALFSARQLAEKLDIPFYIFDASSIFKKTVVDYFISEYKAGRTPNPCMMCNKFVKFGWLIDQAKKLGAQFVATGHHARIKLNKKTGFFELFRGKDRKKDQSYFLWMLSQKQLAHILFPIGNYTKAEVRKMAKKWSLPTGERKESQGICFIPDRDVPQFLKRYIRKLKKPGPIKDLKGNVLGTHQGLAFYTIGQRQRIGIGGRKGKKGPLYVIALDIKTNSLIVGEDKDCFSKELLAEKVNWIVPVSSSFKCEAQIRYGHLPEKAKINRLNSEVKVEFFKKVRAITPGQAVVFYQGDKLLGGGIIKS